MAIREKILLIEDDKDLNELLVFKLKSQNYDVIFDYDIEDIEKKLDSDDFSLLIIDRNLPSGDSLKKINQLRKYGYNEPIILLTAKSLHQDLIDGFENGCDDYIFKPFDFKELLLRIQVILKRTKINTQRLFFKRFILDLNNKELFFENNKIELSKLEFELLKCFFENQNSLLTRHFLSENVWQDDITTDKTINTAILRLKNKIPSIKNHIVSIRGSGYKLC